MLPALAGFAAKALLPSKKKIDKDKLLNRKESSAIEKVDKEVLKQPTIKRKTISTNLLLPQSEIKALPPATEVKKSARTGKLNDVFEKVNKTLRSIIDSLKSRENKTKEEEKVKQKDAKIEENKEKEEKLERKERFKTPKFKIKTPRDKFNIMRFFQNILLGSIALAIFNNLEEIIETLKNVFQTIKDFITKLGEFFSPLWNGFKWIVGKGTELVGKLLGIPSENLDDKDILKNLNEIKSKIPFLENLFKGIENTINSIRGGGAAEPGQSGGITSTASGDLFEIIAGGEGGYNSVNRGNAGDTPGGAQSIFGKPLTEMTVGEVVAAQQSRRVFAVGKYQIIPDTMTGFLNQMRIPNSAKFDEATQEKFKDYVINFKRPEVGKYIRGESSNRAEAVQELAREFASVGLSYAEAGRVRGQSRYAGTAGNRASISPEAVEAALDRARSGTSSGISAEAKQIQDTGTYTVAGVTYDVKTGAPTQVQPPQAQVAPVQPAPAVSESVPQIMQQAEYEVSYQGPKSTILPIPIGGQGSTQSNMSGGSTIVPIGLPKKEALNSYYQAQLMGFLYKQG